MTLSFFNSLLSGVILPRQDLPLGIKDVTSFSSIHDADQPRNTSKDPLQVPNGPMTRSKTKTLKDALNALVLKVATKSELEGPLEYQEEILVHLIHVQEGSNTTLFGQ